MGEVVLMEGHWRQRSSTSSLKVRKPHKIIRRDRTISSLGNSLGDLAGRPASAVAETGDPPGGDFDTARELTLSDLVGGQIDGQLHEPSFSPTETLVQGKILVSLGGQSSGLAQAFSMAKAKEKPPVRFPDGRELPPQFIREWRKYRGFTLERLAEKIGMSPGNLSNIETNKTPYDRDNLHAIAVALDCELADLLTRDPNDPDPLGSLWKQWGPRERQTMLEIARVIFGKKAR